MPADGDFTLQIDGDAGFQQSSPGGRGLFAFDQCHEYLMPNKLYLVRNPRNGRHGMLTADVLAAMNDCSIFRSMDGHVDHLLKSNPSMRAHAGDIRNVLVAVQNDGLTITAAEVCAGLKVNRSALLQDDSPVVAIITWERPRALERLLESMEQNRLGNRTVPCYVIDDSRQEKNIARNRAIIDSFRGKGWTSLVYLGAEQLRNILEALVSQLPHHERAIRFLLDRAKWADYHSCGVSKNYALLATAGQRLVLFDDDAICDVYEPVAIKPGVSLGNVQREVDFFDDPGDWQQYRAVADHDPVHRHAQCLGMKLGDALGVLKLESVGEHGLSHTRPVTVASITSDSPVLVTTSGYLGDPGSTTNRWIAKVGNRSRDRLLKSDHKLLSALTTRMVWLGRERHQVQTQFNMSPVTGFDNRVGLPPFVPIFRGQDKQFGKMVELIFPASVCLEYPWAVQHLPVETRRWKIEQTDFFCDRKFPGFFDNYIAWQKNFCFADEPTERMAHLGRAFIELARRPQDSIMELYRDNNIGAQAKHVQILSGILSDSQAAPALWQRLINEAINQASTDITALMKEKGITGYPEHLTDEKLLGFWRDFWEGLGSAILAWPEIRNAAPLAMQQCGIQQ